MNRFSALVVTVALALSGCAMAPGGPPRRTDGNFALVQQGMTRDEVMAITGPPDNTMPFPLSGTDSWGYYYWDTWGYYCEQSITFAADGRVISKLSRRVSDSAGRD